MKAKCTVIYLTEINGQKEKYTLTMHQYVLLQLTINIFSFVLGFVYATYWPK